MNTVYADKITSIVAWLRSNVYNDSKFPSIFIENLTKAGYLDIKFIPDQLGGWSVSASLDIAKFGINQDTLYSNTSEANLAKVSSIILYIVNKYYKSDMFIIDEFDMCNAVNIIITGPSSIIIKL